VVGQNGVLAGDGVLGFFHSANHLWIASEGFFCVAQAIVFWRLRRW
jgi:hypothetical protein